MGIDSKVIFVTYGVDIKRPRLKMYIVQDTLYRNFTQQLLYGAAVYFFLADGDLQQREWIFVAV